MLDELLRSGALLFRGFGPTGVEAFADFVRLSARPLSNYRGGASPRRQIIDGVYTSTDYPAAVDLSLHNEMSYTYRWPTHLFFLCMVAPENGGETPLADSRALLRRVGSEIVTGFSEKQIMYIRRLPGRRDDHYSWQRLSKRKIVSQLKSIAARETWAFVGNPTGVWS